jgi:hypothetical protein
MVAALIAFVALFGQVQPLKGVSPQKHLYEESKGNFVKLAVDSKNIVVGCPFNIAKVKI